MTAFNSLTRETVHSYQRKFKFIFLIQIVKLNYPKKINFQNFASYFFCKFIIIIIILLVYSVWVLEILENILKVIFRSLADITTRVFRQAKAEMVPQFPSCYYMPLM